ARIMKNQLQDALDTVKSKGSKRSRVAFQGHWQGFDNRYRHDVADTSVSRSNLELIGKALSTWPEGFQIHPKIKRMAEERGKAVAEGKDIDWALGELLAFGSLLLEGTPVRLSGQDSRRGTFSQRHSYWYDTTTRERYKPLNHIASEQANFCVYNSFLSEAAVLGFDYGYSLSEPNMLIIWEAQFGDFVNGAQVIIDQFLTSSETKWNRVSGLVMMLPHGQEGMGPEHSSARLERFLQAAAEDNIQVAHCTTAAQHFHILRRQMKRSFRKPLILMTPKSHLRSKAASSPLNDFIQGRFNEVLGDTTVNAKQVDRLVLCSGKVAHDLHAKRESEGLSNVAIIRLEQLYPFPRDQLAAVLKAFGKTCSVTWCQEEPQNMGAWTFVLPYLQEMGMEPQYAGRKAAASPAPGSASRWKSSQDRLIDQALGLAPISD
ncbi:MAG: 2-oxoglutarate dehydrogenase E1 component, partial [Planctomycetota bacterium]